MSELAADTCWTCKGEGALKGDDRTCADCWGTGNRPRYVGGSWEALLRRVTYKPRHVFDLAPGPTSDEGLALIHRLEVEDSRNPHRSERQKLVFMHPLPPWVDEAWGMAWLRECIREDELHESDEWLKLDGQIVNDPHERVR